MMGVSSEQNSRSVVVVILDYACAMRLQSPFRSPKCSQEGTVQHSSLWNIDRQDFPTCTGRIKLHFAVKRDVPPPSRAVVAFCTQTDDNLQGKSSLQDRINKSSVIL
mmetsp:Transcript_16592/g.38114  ORF Transcript_16592/g.38114 Transcript_16592/m.38114 type:complete len:107 (+) Transcript_16592:263-583(+)